jgi:alkylation response protein AidB-like acyl-CoA dehydrogenase
MRKLPYLDSPDWPSVLEGIAQRAQAYDISTDWPQHDLAGLEAAGAMRWSIPAQWGGQPLSALQLHLRYEQLAAASVATALIFTQRDAAAGLIAGSDNASKRESLLRRLADNASWMTVGIAQLTTSRQGAKPALLAERVAGGFLLNGVIPWCTGGHQSTFIVAGATLAGGQQILFVLQQHQQGVQWDRPMQLVALTCTLTSGVRLKNVLIDDKWLLRGPADGVLGGRHTSLVLGQCFTATGLCRSATDLIQRHTSDAAQEAFARFDKQLGELRDEVMALSAPGREPEAQAANARLRAACNDLALRTTHAAVSLYKGSALLKSHPAQRLAREAMFLLVWSCPNPVIECTVDMLTVR